MCVVGLAMPCTVRGSDDPVVEPVPTASSIAKIVGRVVEQQLSTRRIAGAVVAVVSDGAVLLCRGYGLADIERATPMTADTVVRPGSISKLLTAIAVQQLAEARRLDLDRDVDDYVDLHIPVSRGAVPVTLRRLLEHRAGFENHFKDLITAGGRAEPLHEWLRRSLPRRLFPDGDVPAYSNYGYALAGYTWSG